MNLADRLGQVLLQNKECPHCAQLGDTCPECDESFDMREDLGGFPIVGFYGRLRSALARLERRELTLSGFMDEAAVVLQRMHLGGRVADLLAKNSLIYGNSAMQEFLRGYQTHVHEILNATSRFVTATKRGDLASSRFQLDLVRAAMIDFATYSLTAGAAMAAKDATGKR